VCALKGLLRLCFADEPSATDLYLMLGYNVSVPSYVRQGLFSRSFNNDDLLPKIRKPVLITHGAARMRLSNLPSSINTKR
jgi:non-heme chloroperoxidase